MTGAIFNFVISGSSDLINCMLLSSMAWCDGYTDPLLVPLNEWLQPPLPLYVKCTYFLLKLLVLILRIYLQVYNGIYVGVNCGVQVNKILPTPSAQHIVVLPTVGDPQLWHAMSNTLVHTFKGDNFTMCKLHGC